MERIYLKKHQLVSGTTIFINDNLNVKNKHLAFNCRQLKKGTRYLACLQRMALFIYIKQNENSRPVIIINMNVLHMFPNFYDLSKEGNENHDTTRDQNAFVFSFSAECMERLW